MGRLVIVLIAWWLNVFLRDCHIAHAKSHLASGAESVSSSGSLVPSKLKSNSSQENYRSNVELEAAMKDFVRRCGNVSRLYSIGKSTNGVPLWVLEISDKPGELEPEPAFKYVGNMHGDEPIGRELLLHLAEWLCSNNLKDPLATLIVQNVHVHLLPSMNPDGFAKMDRNNAHDVDLNRDFPDQFLAANNNESVRQPETRAVMQWIRDYRFVASASLHEGALVVSYPWDGSPTGKTKYTESPDDITFQYMASLYSEFHPSMKNSKEFLGGVTNGAAWYPLYGGMQDWNYIHGNCLEITLEIYETKWPPFSKVVEIWQQHKQSMLELVASVVKSSVHGRVVSSLDGRPLPAVISVKGVSHTVTASATFGDYHRILPAGRTYELTASMAGYNSKTDMVVLAKHEVTKLDFILDPFLSSEEVLAFSTRLKGFSRPKATGKAVEKVDVQTSFPKNTVPTKSPETISNLWFDKDTSEIYSGTRLRLTGDKGDMVSEMILDHLKVSSFGATVAVLGSLLYVLVRWRGSSRLGTRAIGR